MTNLPSMFKEDHYSANSQNELTKLRNVTNVPQRLVLEMGKAVKQVSTRQRTHRKTFVTTTIILFSSKAALIFNSGRAPLESRVRYWLS